MLATNSDEGGGCWRALNPTRTVRGEEAEERGWKAARRRCFRSGRRRRIS
jgi:hypothetical protein